MVQHPPNPPLLFFYPLERKHRDSFHPPNSLVLQRREQKESKVQLISLGHSVTFLQRGRWADDEAHGFKWNHPQSQLWQDRDEEPGGDETISKTKSYELQCRRHVIRLIKRLWGTRIKGTSMGGDGEHFLFWKKKKLSSTLIKIIGVCDF